MVAVLIPVVALAIYSNFSASVKIWERVHRQTSYEDLDLFILKTTRTLNGALRHSLIDFEADKESFSFAGFLETDEKFGGESGIGKIRIFYDERERSIKKEEKNVSALYREKPGKFETLLRGVGDFKASFLVFDKEYRKFVWVEEWTDRPKEEIPLAVRLRFNFTDLTGTKPFTNTFAVPVGGVFEK